MARVISYVVARDYGFAPNPFHGTCTLATCISPVRRTASVGDILIGTGTATRGFEGRLVYAMRVTDSVTFDEYWTDGRFQEKKPNLSGSRKQQYGDNIYCTDSNGQWQQANSHHSRPDGSLNRLNVDSDTKVDRVLVSEDFSYWGGTGPRVPAQFRNWNDVDIVRTSIGHRHNFPEDLVAAFLEWLDPQLGEGVLGRPFSW